MFESAELGRKLSKEEFDTREPDMRKRLLDAQFRLADAKVSVILLITGMEGAGKGETVNMLVDWLDPRAVEVHAVGPPTEEERERPAWYRYWRRLPPHGKIGVFIDSWYADVARHRYHDEIDHNQFEHELRQITEYESMLAAENVLLVKCYLHISKKEQKKKFKKLEDAPATAWRVTKSDWRQHKAYDRIAASVSDAIRITSTAEAPWHIIEAADKRYRHMSVAEILCQSLEEKLAEPSPPPPPPPVLPEPAKINILNQLDLTQSIEKKEYDHRKKMLQEEIGRMSLDLKEAGTSVVLAFEGADAAGKGGTIRRLTAPIDARFYRVVRIAAPTDEEKARPYLWRFWRQLPRRGRYVIFDRSWYGRVLVERLEGFCSTEDWQRAYGEINSFEEQLVDSGIVLLKFYLWISSEEQLRRFEAREVTEYKQYKITPDDWRNREKQPAYEAAACDMIEATNTVIAPWTVIAAEDKRFARIRVMETVAEKLREVLGK